MMEVAMVRRVAMVGGSVVMAAETALEMGEEVQTVKEEVKTTTGVMETRQISRMEKGRQGGATAVAARKQQGQGCGNEAGAVTMAVMEQHGQGCGKGMVKG